jgi:hypothetical protein
VGRVLIGFHNVSFLCESFTILSYYNTVLVFLTISS